MPDAAEVELLVLQLLHLDDLGKAGDALHERIFDRSSDAAGEGHELGRRQRLVLEEHHQVLEPRGANLLELGILQPAQVDARDFGAERAGDALDFHPSHAPFACRWSSRSFPSSDSGLTPKFRQRCAALPATCPIPKRAPETRAADWPPLVIVA